MVAVVYFIIYGGWPREYSSTAVVLVSHSLVPGTCATYLRTGADKRSEDPDDDGFNFWVDDSSFFCRFPSSTSAFKGFLWLWAWDHRGAKSAGSYVYLFPGAPRTRGLNPKGKG